MAGGRQKVPIVSVDEKGDIYGYYESVSEAAQLSGINRRYITDSLRIGRPRKGYRWVRESEYRKLWFEGRTDELSFSYKQMRFDAKVKAWRGLTEEQRKNRSRRLSESRKRIVKERPEIMEPSREAHRRPVLCINTGECFRSVVELGRTYGLNPSSVRSCISRGQRNKGYIVKYITKEEYEEYNKNRNQEKDRRNPD